MDFPTIMLLLVLIGIIFNLFLHFTSKKDDGSHRVSDRVDVLNKNMIDTMTNMQKIMNDRMKENAEFQQKGSKEVGVRLDNAAKAVHMVTAKLAKVEEANKRIYDIGKDISSLQEILKTPKLRGNLGELFLEDLLTQIFPKEHYSLQHRFKDGTIVDAMIMLRDNMVSVDSKFPLENFVHMINREKENDENEAKKERKLFVTQVKKHISDIADKYIKTDEGTLDFALMYIPAENVYYETIMKDDMGLVAYAHEKKVFPVSPNSFYIYLQAILMGLRGMQIEKETKNIISGIGRMKKEFEKFEDDYRLVGKHLGNAASSFDKSDKRLEKFSGKMEFLEGMDNKGQGIGDEGKGDEKLL